LRLDPSLPDGELRLAFEGCLASEQRAVRTTAERIARRIGRNLGYVLLTLKRGDAVNRAARPEWDNSYWRHWGGINRVWLGGGLVSGRLGPAVRGYALAVVHGAGVGDYNLQISPYAALLPLVGAARHAPPACGAALAFDFGSTMVKRARALYRGDELVELHRLPSWPTRWEQIAGASDDPAERAARLLKRLVSVVTSTWHAVGPLPSSPVLASVAAYVQDGHPMPGQGGGYYYLRHITDNAQGELARRVSAELGEAVDVRLLHDGTAAAATYAGAENTAVITVGTALGIGFPPAGGSLLGIDANLAIVGLD